MEFPKEVREARFISLLRSGKTDKASVEYRKDPLTGAISRINIARAHRVRQAQPVQKGGDVAEVIERSRLNCMFCPRSVEKATPTFPAELWPEGRIARGETLVFPNLYPFAEHHAVGVVCREHFLDLPQFTVSMLVDTLLAGQEYYRAVHEAHPTVRYPTWVWNYMPPSAASIIHPHVQMMIESTPTIGLARALDASQRYARNQKGNYWTDLVSAESCLGHRLIHQNESLAVLATYAPRGTREVQIIVKDVSSLTEMEPAVVTRVASALLAVLRAYHASGVNSFNVVSFSAPVCERLAHFWLSFRVVSRPRFQAFYTGDSGFMERFFGESVVDTLPEHVASSFRRFFEE